MIQRYTFVVLLMSWLAVRAAPVRASDDGGLQWATGGFEMAYFLFEISDFLFKSRLFVRDGNFLLELAICIWDQHIFIWDWFAGLWLGLGYFLFEISDFLFKKGTFCRDWRFLFDIIIFSFEIDLPDSGMAPCKHQGEGGHTMGIFFLGFAPWEMYMKVTPTYVR